jgi:hypothetical protein
MELQTHDLRELAEFFAKRFPRTNDRRLLLDQLRLPHREHEGQPPIQAWMSLLEIARDRRALTRLGEAAQRLRPFDENLASMTNLLHRSEGGQGRGTFQMVGMVMAALLAVGSTWAAVTGSSEAKNNDEDRDRYSSAEIETASAPTPAPETVTIHAASSANTDLQIPDWANTLGNVEQAEIEPASETESTPPPPTTVHTASTLPSAYHNGRCTTAKDGVVGYWYAGEDAPGTAGQVVVIDHSVNVRADYPDHHNSYDARATVRCQLAGGDEIRLTADPILVPGNRYWVPLYNGDLIRGDA